jgi:hypothetical protein
VVQKPHLLGNCKALCFYQVKYSITNKESEVNMPEFEHNRRERLEAAIREVTSSKEKPVKFLQEVGILDATGELAPLYR